jgi:hypothetical protein
VQFLSKHAHSPTKKGYMGAPNELNATYAFKFFKAITFFALSMCILAINKWCST